MSARMLKPMKKRGNAWRRRRFWKMIRREQYNIARDRCDP